MNQQDLENLGENIQDVIEKAVSSQSYQKLNQSITQMVNATLKQYQSSMPKAKEREEMERKRREQKALEKKIPDVYSNTSSFRTSSILKTIFGGLLVLGMASGMLATAIIHAATGAAFAPEILTVVGTLAGVGLLGSGISGLGAVSRFKQYRKVLGARTYCDFKAFSKAIGRPIKFIKKDIKKMIDRGWFMEGHVDQKETCLIVTDETYQQYQHTELQYQQEQRVKAEEELRRVQKQAELSPEVEEVLKQGNAFLDKIHKSNEAIPGEEISEKISRMEQIVDQIFTRAKEHPEIVPDLKKMMNYYLPTAVKLLDAYEDMDKQPIQGENIRSSKKEIEDTLDTLNQAFAKLLDSVFQDTAWDVSSDISVLHTVLAQEGLTESAFQMQK